NNSTILLRGESGTGKELFARAIQNLSTRRMAKFFTLNCAAIPDTLVESELFGYEKGSFTGASDKGKVGLFEEASGGTIFLDEIGELSLKMQSKLLRVLQEGKIRRIGSNTEINVDVRIIAATNRNLEKMIDEKAFREDLFYRLNVIPVFIPPLNERRVDIPDLVAVFICKYNMKLKMDVKGVESEVLEHLIYNDWKGNVRQLENVIERSMNLTSGKIIRCENLMLDIPREANRSMLLTNDENLKLKEIVEICEKAAIEKVLRSQKSYRKTAKLLGVSHTTLINKVKKYSLE
ncbi:MAG: sigma 54-interacting transcriptional regulator, partial [Acidaminobacteraceae bacterium]